MGESVGRAAAPRELGRAATPADELGADDGTSKRIHGQNPKCGGREGEGRGQVREVAQGVQECRAGSRYLRESTRSSNNLHQVCVHQGRHQRVPSLHGRAFREHSPAAVPRGVTSRSNSAARVAARVVDTSIISSRCVFSCCEGCSTSCREINSSSSVFVLRRGAARVVERSIARGCKNDCTNVEKQSAGRD